MKTPLQLLLIIATFFLLMDSLNSQILIGMKETDIIKYMEQNLKSYTLNTGFGATPTTVKFIDSKNDRTIIFFLDDKKKCKYSKLMLDIEEWDKTIEVMNKTYSKSGELKWAVKKDGKNYELYAEKTEWMFSIVTQLKE
ncbi:MAG: hypothetical protein ABIJ97_11965 [Bacteroidota bacterium]